MLNLSASGMMITDVIILVLSLASPFAVFFLAFLVRRKAAAKPGPSDGSLSFREYVGGEGLCPLIAAGLFALGFAARLAFVDLYPAGFNQDEASAAYDAYAIMTAGIDRNANAFPIHLVAWGSGQNALYSYMMIPFIWLLGLNVLAVRLPMALFGCLSLWILYRLGKEYLSKEEALALLAFAVISPWHIMKSRWGLESNIFPDLVLLGVFLLMAGLRKDRFRLTLISAAVLAVAAYSYGTSYYFLFFFVIAFLIYLSAAGKLRWWKSLIYVTVVGLICLPLMIFIYINIKGLDSVRFLIFTIPKLTANRFQDVTNLYSGSFLSSAWDNLKNGMYLLATQYDYLPWNSIPVYGAIYVFSLPFMFIGLFRKKREKEHVISNIMLIWLIVAFSMLFIISANINRINIIFFPMIYFTALGLQVIGAIDHKARAVLAVLYACSFALFARNYAVDNQKTLEADFFYSFGQAIQLAVTLPSDRVYVTDNVNMPYIYVLFYAKYDVRDFVGNHEYSDPDSSFRNVVSFGKYYFYLPSYLSADDVYIMDNDKVSCYNTAGYMTEEFARYTVIWHA